MVAYKRFDLRTFGIFENWSLGRGDRLREVVVTGGSTVVKMCFMSSQRVAAHSPDSNAHDKSVRQTNN